jgi:hypothetical protein
LEEIAQAVEDYIVLAVENFPGEISNSTLLSMIQLIRWKHDLIEIYRKNTSLLEERKKCMSPA